MVWALLAVLAMAAAGELRNRPGVQLRPLDGVLKWQDTALVSVWMSPHRWGPDWELARELLPSRPPSPRHAPAQWIDQRSSPPSWIGVVCPTGAPGSASEGHETLLATTGIAPFMALMDQVMTRQPYNNAGRVFVVAGNGSATAAKRQPEGSPAATRTRS